MIVVQFIRAQALRGQGCRLDTGRTRRAQGNITWRMVTTWPKNFPGLGVGTAQRLPTVSPRPLVAG